MPIGTKFIRKEKLFLEVLEWQKLKKKKQNKIKYFDWHNIFHTKLLENI